MNTDSISEPVDSAVPVECITARQMKNLTFLLYSVQNLLNKACGADVYIDQSVVDRLLEHTPETAADFEALLDDFKARGLLRGVSLRDEMLTMSFPQDEHRELYARLQQKIVEHAMQAKRLQPKLVPLGDSEKYRMHNWLMRIGCGGPDFKALRRRMTENLTGYCAFPDQASADRHKAKHTELRRSKALPETAHGPP